RFPFSVFRFPFSVFRFPFSVFRFPFSVFCFLFSVFSLFYSMSKYAVIPTKVGIWNARLEQAFYPISFRTDRPRFPPARE
ncbi:hypothetical protein, partial [Neisseria gonorrhoeae]|uniref:hypothetical protein n=2 Tax=Neisseria gonorrhoeae TaxID=485 RepID=UPI001BC9A797